VENQRKQRNNLREVKQRKRRM